ncbi:MAG TPA: chromate resistance protein ChrB domain-containing protein, partial [Geminicoccaceae bacterium]|nr:chromate resistance protein ChrB domain-containing protein [Geminicoccaceae bacterium]
FFGADRRVPLEALLAELEQRVAAPASGEPPQAASREADVLQNCRGRTWVTRQGVYVDRIASAWLIRRFIDPAAQFKFVPAKGYEPAPGELRFDMFEAEFTHRGDRCTFEVLLERAGLEDAALRAIAEIVHDIDLKDAKYGRDEAAGVASLMAGIVRAHGRDEDRLAQGIAVFENLYASFPNRRRASR